MIEGGEVIEFAGFWGLKHGFLAKFDFGISSNDSSDFKSHENRKVHGGLSARRQLLTRNAGEGRDLTGAHCTIPWPPAAPLSSGRQQRSLG
jgi:hypothetical protein